MTKGLTQRVLVLSVLLVALVLAGCGSDEPTAESETEGTTTESAAPVANACPAEGCEIKIVDATRDGDEIAVTWEANFVPDVSKNHIHIYWDRYTADQVSSDAEARGVTQGEWVPTDEVPTYETESAVDGEPGGLDHHLRDGRRPRPRGDRRRDRRLRDVSDLL